MRSDLDIAQAAELKKIEQIASEAGIRRDIGPQRELNFREEADALDLVAPERQVIARLGAELIREHIKQFIATDHAPRVISNVVVKSCPRKEVGQMVAQREVRLCRHARAGAVFVPLVVLQARRRPRHKNGQVGCNRVRE